MVFKKSDNYANTASYQKALKKVAVQIANNIKVDVVYRNVPFGPSQLDIHSDGDNVILAVKVLTGTDDAFNVREFQTPVSKFRKFLTSDKVQEMFPKRVSRVFLDDIYLTKQISQGISQLMHNSKKQSYKEKNETWVFPFYNHFITFHKNKVKSYRAYYDSSGFFDNQDVIEGVISQVRIDSKNTQPDPIEFFVRGFETYPSKRYCLDYSIYEALNKANSKKLILAREYDLMCSEIKQIAT